MIEEVLENTENVVKVNGLVVSAVIFADDQAMASNSRTTENSKRTEQDNKRLW